MSRIREALDGCASIKKYRLAQYGSTVNGLRTKGSSDVDLTILVDRKSVHIDQFLSKVQRVLKKAGFHTFFLRLKNCQLLEVRDVENGQKFDLTVNAELSVRAAQLFKAYTVNQPTF